MYNLSSIKITGKCELVYNFYPNLRDMDYCCKGASQLVTLTTNKMLVTSLTSWPTWP